MVFFFLLERLRGCAVGGLGGRRVEVGQRGGGGGVLYWFVRMGCCYYYLFKLAIPPNPTLYVKLARRTLDFEPSRLLSEIVHRGARATGVGVFSHTSPYSSAGSFRRLTLVLSSWSFFGFYALNWGARGLWGVCSRGWGFSSLKESEHRCVSKVFFIVVFLLATFLPLCLLGIVVRFLVLVFFVLLFVF